MFFPPVYISLQPVQELQKHITINLEDRKSPICVNTKDIDSKF